MSRLVRIVSRQPHYPLALLNRVLTADCRETEGCLQINLPAASGRWRRSKLGRARRKLQRLVKDVRVAEIVRDREQERLILRELGNRALRLLVELVVAV
jgi:hypothetical protein